MRTIKEFQAENDVIRSRNTTNGKPTNPDTPEWAKANKAIAINNQCIRILEQGLTQEKLTKQLDALNSKLSLIDDEDRFKTWEANTPNTWKGINLNHYRLLNGRANIIKQIKFMEYLLS